MGKHHQWLKGWLAIAGTLSLAPMASALAEESPQLPEWAFRSNSLVTLCHFEDFVDTIDFVNQLVAPAEALGHHPDLAIAYNQLTISLTTHDAGGVTALDLALAEEISRLSQGRCQPPP